MGMLKFNGTYCQVGIPAANDMDFNFSYIPLIFTQKKIAGFIVTGTRRMARMLQMTKDELQTYANDSDEWNAKVVKFDQVNDIMDDLLHGRNTKQLVQCLYVATRGRSQRQRPAPTRMASFPISHRQQQQKQQFNEQQSGRSPRDFCQDGGKAVKPILCRSTQSTRDLTKYYVIKSLHQVASP